MPRVMQRYGKENFNLSPPSNFRLLLLLWSAYVDRRIFFGILVALKIFHGWMQVRNFSLRSFNKSRCLEGRQTFWISLTTRFLIEFFSSTSSRMSKGPKVRTATHVVETWIVASGQHCPVNLKGGSMGHFWQIVSAHPLLPCLRHSGLSRNASVWNSLCLLHLWHLYHLFASNGRSDAFLPQSKGKLKIRLLSICGAITQKLN